MAFSFGATPNPAPAPGGFGAPAPAPSTGGFAFGGASNPAPAPGGFGAPAPATGGFGAFGGTPNPAPAPGAFGTPAPSTGGFGFGNNTPAPAPGGGGFSFGGTPAPAPGRSLFGGPPAPAAAGGFNFAQPTGTPVALGAAPNAMLSLHGKTTYNQLPQDMKKAIDTIHEAMMKHKRSIVQVQGMGPQSLIITNKKEALPPRLKKLHIELNAIQQKLFNLQAVTTKYRDTEKQIVSQAYQYAKWPTEAMAARRGVRLHVEEEKKDPDMQNQLREMLEQQLQYVDRIESMPSPYLWQTLDQMHQTLNSLSDDVTNIRQQLQRSSVLDDDVVNVTNIIDNQDQIIYVLRRDLHKLHYDMSKLRKAYTASETGENVLDKAQMEEWERQKSIDEQLQIRLLRSSKDSSQTANQTPAAPGAGGAPAPSTSGFAFGGSAPAPAPTGTSSAPSAFSFGGSAPAPAGGAPAPSTSGFSFGGSNASNPAPAAPAFGAPATSTFGAAPAPAFGAAAPVGGFGGIAKPSTSTATSTPSKKKGGSRGRSRR